ncbi:Crp/Fnr family transcriptional regulator [Profundibacter sp.]|uniref:Crp/Fnr family transcriptional regulator n=1 Tax=Profundibacter sp. TaxID=3101071 RepID=UPI003D0FB205
MDKKTEAIARESLFLSSLPETSVSMILSNTTDQCFKQGETIFLQGDPADNIYIVIEGWVKLYRIAPNGAEAIVGVFTAGHSFGEALALRHEVYPVAAEAVTDSHVISMPTSVLTGLIESDPEIAISMLASTFQHLHSIVLQLEQIKAFSGAQRVAEFLVGLCPVSEGACTVTLPYDKSLIAGRLGMKPESLSRAFAKLRKQGVTVRQNHAAISDVEGLHAFATGDEELRLRKSV